MLSSVRVAACVRSTEAEGPGRRWALWVQGCPLRCAGCCNPAMQPRRAKGGGDMLATVEALAEDAIATDGIEGVTFLGGEPLAQAAPLADLAERVRGAGLTVMVFSGYTLAELRVRSDEGTRRLLDATDLLVDGRYDRTRPERRRRWIGSENQVQHCLTTRYRSDDPRFVRNNSVELRFARGVITINGWPEGVPRLGRVG